MAYSERAQNTRDMLQGVIDEQARKKNRFVASLDHSSLTALALSAAARKREENDVEHAEEKADAAAMREKWTESYMRRVAPEVTAHFAKKMGLATDSPLLAELSWRLHPDKVAALNFTRNDAGRIVARAPEGERNAFLLLADIDALTIAARTYDDRESGEISMVVFSADHGSVSRGITDLSALGEELERARELLGS